MCRLCAVVPRKGKFSATYANAINSTMLLDMLIENGRLSNKDGFGMTTVETGKTYKKMISIEEGVKDIDLMKWMWDNTHANQVLIGHTRLSTTGKGSKDDRHAHPFVLGNWILAHNGHLSNYEELAIDLKVPKEVMVDSEIGLYALMSVVGSDKTLTMPTITRWLGMLEGSYAFIVANLYEPDRVYLIAGSNPLNVYTNQRLHLVNTDAGLNPYLSQRHAVASLQAGWHQVEFTKESLITNHAYVLSESEGLVELGTFVPKVVVSKYYQNWQAATSTQEVQKKTTPMVTTPIGVGDLINHTNDEEVGNMVNMEEAVQEVSNLNAFLKEINLTVADLTDMLLELPSVIPSSVFDLNEYHVVLLRAWFNYLSTRVGFDSSRMPEKRTIWYNFVMRTEQPYESARGLDAEFLTPYYLNSLELLDRVIGAK